MMAASTRTKGTTKPVPSRLAVYLAICNLSPAAYAPLARMIISTAEAERENQIRRRNRRHRKPGTVHNIGKPVIDIDADATRPSA